MFLLPKFIQNGTLGRLEATAIREFAGLETQKIWLIYIENGVAHLATNDDPQVNDYNWEHQYEIGPAVDVAIESDANWYEENDPETARRFDLTTDADPWFFWVTPDGALMAQKGFTTEEFEDPILPTELVAADVTRVAAIRGWKNIKVFEEDQGLIAAYIQSGVVKYRNYCQQSDGINTVWEAERTVAEFGTPATEIGLFRTNDFRIGFIAVIDGSIFWALTNNNWSGLGLGNEHVDVNIEDITINFIKITHLPTENEELVTIGIVNLASILLWAVDTNGVSAINSPTMTEVTEPELIGTGNNSETSFDLLHAPESGTETIYLDEVEVDSDDYTIDGKTIIFDSPPGSGVEVTAIYTWEDWGKNVTVLFDHGLTNLVGHHSQFILEDANEATYAAIATAAGEDHPPKVGYFEGPRKCIISFADFNNAYSLGEPVGEMTISYTEGVGYLQGEAGQDDVRSLSLSFTPINLDPIPLEPPIVEEVWNE